MAYPNIQKDPKLLKIETKDDDTEEITDRTEKHDQENISKLLKIDSYKKKYKSWNKKKVILIITENLIGSASTTGALVH